MAVHHSISLYKDLTALLAAGIPAPRALELLSKQYTNKRICKAIGMCAENTKKGISLAQSLSQHPKVFHPVFTRAVHHAEQSGNMPAALDALLPVALRDIYRQIYARTQTLLPVKILLTTIAVGVCFIAAILLAQLLSTTLF